MTARQCFVLDLVIEDGTSFPVSRHCTVADAPRHASSIEIRRAVVDARAPCPGRRPSGAGATETAGVLVRR